jgi:hypothetical protein
VSTSDNFDRFADECSLRLTAEPLCVAPRDMLAPLDEIEQHFLVSLTRSGTAESPVRLVFLAPLRTLGGPSLRDVLWWVAGDAWALDRTDYELTEWAATYGYPETEDATVWLFEQARRQATALTKLLGDSNMRRLLDLYEADVGHSRSP